MNLLRSLLLALVSVAGAHAQIFYPSIDTSYMSAPGPSGTSYTSIPVGNTFANGVTATLTMQSGQFRVTSGFFANVNGAVVFNNTPGDAAIFNFSSTLTDFRLNFAADGNTGSSSMRVQAYLNNQLVGSQVFGSAVPQGWQFDEGQIDFTLNSGFDKVIVSLQGIPSIENLWAIGADANHTGNLGGSAPVPEPSTYGLMLGGLALAVVAARRRLKK